MIYTGEILRNTTSTTIAIGIMAVAMLTLAFLQSENSGIVIRATTIGRIPLKILSTVVLSLNCTKNIAIDNIATKAGKQVATTQRRAPFLPKKRLPINIAILTAKIPGDICAILK